MLIIQKKTIRIFNLIFNDEGKGRFFPRTDWLLNVSNTFYSIKKYFQKSNNNTYINLLTNKLLINHNISSSWLGISSKCIMPQSLWQCILPAQSSFESFLDLVLESFLKKLHDILHGTSQGRSFLDILYQDIGAKIEVKWNLCLCGFKRSRTYRFI